MSRASTIARVFGEDGALNAADVAGLGALATRGTVSSSHIDDSAVTAEKIASGAAVSNIGYTPVNKEGDTITGNLGIGVTPSAWGSNRKAIQFGALGCVFSDNNVTSEIGANVYISTAPAYTYITSNYASRYAQINGEHRWYTAPSGSAGGTISFSQAMTLTESGNLGVGTTSPDTKLEIEAASPILRLTDSTSVVQGGVWGAIEWKGSDGSLGPSGYITGKIDVVDEIAGGAFYGDRGAMRFYTNNSSALGERARLTAGGYFKASNDGTYVSAVDTYHEMRSNASNWAAVFSNSNAVPYVALFRHSNAAPNATSNEFIYCDDTSGQRASIRSNGGLANYSANNVNLSDERVKTDIKPLGSMWDKFKSIEIVTFKYKDQTHDDDNIGVIAQQVESVAPEFVDADGWGKEPPEDGVPLKAIYTEDFHNAAIKALQEAMTRIEELEAKVAALESN